MADNQLKILVVDDDDVDRILIRELLSKVSQSEVTVVEASTLEEAKRKIGSEEFDAFLIDYLLGHVNGTEFIHEAKAIGCKTPIIVITGVEDEKLDNEVIQAGASDYIPKSELSPALLERTIVHAIDRRVESEKLEQLVKQDPLTGLANRTLFNTNLENAMARANRNKAQLAVMLLDLDRFKDINDSLGHLVGDELLECVASRLTDTVRTEDIVARLGGDEFSLLLENVESLNSVSRIAEKILKALSTPMQIEEHEIVISASIGISIYPQAGQSREEILKNADLALYQVKEKGRNGYHIFDASIESNTKLEKSVREKLAYALREQNLFMEFAPQNSLKDKITKAVEARVIARYENESYSIADSFNQSLISANLMIEAEKWALDRICEQLCRVKKDASDLKIVIKPSKTFLYNKNFLKQLKGCVSDRNTQLNGLELLIDESILTSLYANQPNLLFSLQKLGIKIILDEFGSSICSLKLIHPAIINKIRVSPSLLNDTSIDSHALALLENLSAIKAKQNIPVIMDGINNQNHLVLIESFGFDLIQGEFVKSSEGIKTLLASSDR
ncbi:diguanylate cyclase domain-containing protein [Aliikangiella sp. IMCC44653]